MENELDLINNEDIKNLIYNIREKQKCRRSNINTRCVYDKTCRKRK